MERDFPNVRCSDNIGRSNPEQWEKQGLDNSTADTLDWFRDSLSSQRQRMPSSDDSDRMCSESIFEEGREDLDPATRFSEATLKRRRGKQVKVLGGQVNKGRVESTCMHNATDSEQSNFENKRAQRKKRNKVTVIAQKESGLDDSGRAIGRSLEQRVSCLRIGEKAERTMNAPKQQGVTNSKSTVQDWRVSSTKESRSHQVEPMVLSKPGNSRSYSTGKIGAEEVKHKQKKVLSKEPSDSDVRADKQSGKKHDQAQRQKKSKAVSKEEKIEAVKAAEEAGRSAASAYVEAQERLAKKPGGKAKGKKVLQIQNCSHEVQKEKVPVIKAGRSTLASSPVFGVTSRIRLARGDELRKTSKRFTFTGKMVIKLPRSHVSLFLSVSQIKYPLLDLALHGIGPFKQADGQYNATLKTRLTFVSSCNTRMILEVAL
jgi:hypothetical protein